jgi:hypothetical protein
MLEKPKALEDAVSAAPSEEGIVIDPQAEKKLVRKLDLYIIPVIFITYLLSYLDRTNIGNAKVAGLTTGLHLKGNEING